MASFKRKADTAVTSATKDPKKAKKDSSLTSFFGAPKPASAVGTTGSADPPAIKFDKEKWAASLTPEQKALLKLEIDTLHISWLAHLKDDLTSPSFLELKRFLQKEIGAGKKIFPPMEEVYSWSNHTPLHKVRAVIIGQDPYHNHNQAHGLCFSVRPPTPAPPSLKNMYIALRNDYPDFQAPPNKGGLLTPWAEQGVLMLNTALTVRAHEAGSHSGKGWEVFTQKVIDTVVKVRTRGVVFLAWGMPAAKRCTKITGSRHLVLKSVHPSPLSASKGFFDCGHFRKTNDWLSQRYGKEGEIDWNLGGSSSTKKETTTEAPPADQQKIVADETTKEPITVSKEAKTAANVNANANAEEFDDEDDADAIEALEELARSSQLEAK
ncbi:hypothetical protein DV737_g2739, partial [Chaetothyriales sp. CBS 132003]